MERLSEISPRCSFEIFTTVPRWFFSTSLTAPFTYHEHLCDVGLVQRTAFEEDLEATAARLEEVDLLATETVNALAEEILELGCRAIVADISPLGLAAARRAGLPAVLVENFTWDWIYRSFDRSPRRLTWWADLFEAEFDNCDLRIRAEPWCGEVNERAQRVEPIARRPRSAPAEVRRDLGIAADEPMVLVSMGGIPWHFPGFEEAAEARGMKIVIPGSGEIEKRRGSLITLPGDTDIDHPGLVGAADVVIAKLGYSTLAEVASAGCPLGWISRPLFPESRELASWVSERLSGFEIPAAEFNSGGWLRRLPELFALPRRCPGSVEGAVAAARMILELVSDFPE